tara:strand:- start:3153 stop:4919 length:1767 start_codon:yes stop_codon:yes gene_type:complete
MEQSDFIRRVTESPDHFAWFLGAGASQSAGLPTAWDIIWDLKRRYYTTEEDQIVPPNDIQNAAVREKIQSYMVSKGFPEEGSPDEYTTYFELIFGDDKERQRRYVSAILADDNASLSLGHRVLAALICSKITKAVFTTNFDNIVERAVAEVGGQSLAPFHIEGAYAANEAINSEQYPVYCKLHGDFRYQSIKNLADDLRVQNAELSKGFLNACNRFGLIVAGYSGRDDSIMTLFEEALQTTNPFPYGLYWTKLKGSEPLSIVTNLISIAQSRGVSAHLVDIETYDSMMSRIWRQIETPSPELDAKVRKAARQEVDIPLPSAGKSNPIIRSNGLPITRLPTVCQTLKFNADKEWKDLRDAEGKSGDTVICAKGEHTLAWGTRKALEQVFGSDLISTEVIDLSDHLAKIESNLYLKALLEKAICLSLKRDKPLVLRPWRGGYALITTAQAQSHQAFALLKSVLQSPLTGDVPGLMTATTEDHPERKQISWAEAVKIDIEMRDGRSWLHLQPDIWIWPRWGRDEALDILDKRKGGRFNRKADDILSAWIKALLPTSGKATDCEVSPFASGDAEENPLFVVNSRTAFSRRSG